MNWNSFDSCLAGEKFFFLLSYWYIASSSFDVYLASKKAVCNIKLIAWIFCLVNKIKGEQYLNIQQVFFFDNFDICICNFLTQHLLALQSCFSAKIIIKVNRQFKISADEGLRSLRLPLEKPKCWRFCQQLVQKTANSRSILFRITMLS